MTPRVAACRYFEAEIRAALEAEGLGRADLTLFQGGCDERSGAAAGAVPALEPGTLLLAGRCAGAPGPMPRFETCFGLLLGEDLAGRFLAQGLHLLTPAMLLAWRDNARAWGFAPETAREFFRESITGFRVVDCGVSPVPQEEREALEAYAGVPVDVWPASLDPLRLWLRLALAGADPGWPAGRSEPWRLSDFAMAYDLIGSLLAREGEAEVAQGIAELFAQLCAAAEVTLQVHAAPGGKAWTCRLADAPAGGKAPEEWPDGGVGNALAGPDGFTLSLPGGPAPIASLRVSGVALPKRRGHYLQLGAMLAPVLGLALADSRRRAAIIAHEVQVQGERTRALLAAIVDSSHDAIVGQDRDGIITAWNQGAVRVFGYTAEESIGQRIERLIPAERLAEETLVMERLQGGESIPPFETVRVRKDGSAVAVSVSISPIRDGGGTLIGASRITRDISELRRAQARILRLNEELEQRVQERTAQLEAANRALEASNRELEAFSYTVSHDLRAPLRAINSFSVALGEDFAEALGATGLDYLERLQAGSRRMSQLIEDLLNLSRIGSTDLVRAPLDLAGLAREVLAELAAGSPARRVETVVRPGLAAWGDRRLLRLALQNLLGNAWKYTRLSEAPRIEVGQSLAGGDRTFFVRDNGTGFDMEAAGKLFAPFQRLHPESQFEGNGIGLATVQRILHRHGGRVWAEARPGLGATFFFTLQDPPDPEA